MINAKSEFLNHISNNKVKCATIRVSYGDVLAESNLTQLYDKEEWDNFLESINLDYDSGYGRQHLYGTIWFEDGTWSTRGEYDGFEWWAHMVQPPIPEELIRLDRIRDEKLNQILK